MTSNQLKHQSKLRDWATAIQECRSSGVSVNQWCKNKGVTATTYYRWERELLALAGGKRNKPQIATTTAFVELPAPPKVCHAVAQHCATVHINDIAIDIYPGMDAELLKTLLEAARQC